jgi:hypothetical protein
MSSGVRDVDAAAVLASARRARAAANAAETQVLVERGRDTGIPIAGPGAPLVSEFAVAEFAAALGLSAGSGRTLVGQALELAHRLPRLWAKVTTGALAPWRARRIAEDTLFLSAEAAGWVDAQVAPFAHKTGPAQTQRLVETAIARFMPDLATAQRERAAEGRYFTIDHDQVSFAGTSRVHGELDLADALDLHDAITTGAAQLAQLGCTDSLDVRRAAAVGMLARGDQPLDLQTLDLGVSTGPTTGGATGSTAEGSTGSTSGRGRRGGRRGREVVLYVHLSEAALRSGPGTPGAAGAGGLPVELENAGGQLITAGQVAAWCGRPDTDQITVKPVIDLHQPHAVDAYAVPEAVAEPVRLRDKTCVFPWCHRPARGCDLDHRVPYVDPDDGGPPGQTSTSNIAPLCRLHHRMKTHGGWTYTMDAPGTYLWRSPHGYTWRRDHTGTTDLTPPPVEPPPP